MALRWLHLEHMYINYSDSQQNEIISLSFQLKTLVLDRDRPLKPNDYKGQRIVMEVLMRLTQLCNFANPAMIRETRTMRMLSALENNPTVISLPEIHEKVQSAHTNFKLLVDSVQMRHPRMIEVE